MVFEVFFLRKISCSEINQKNRCFGPNVPHISLVFSEVIAGITLVLIDIDREILVKFGSKLRPVCTYLIHTYIHTRIHINTSTRAPSVFRPCEVGKKVIFLHPL